MGDFFLGSLLGSKLLEGFSGGAWENCMFFSSLQCFWKWSMARQNNIYHIDVRVFSRWWHLKYFWNFHPYLPGVSWSDLTTCAYLGVSLNGGLPPKNTPHVLINFSRKTGSMGQFGKPTILGNPPFFKWVGGFNHQPFPGILREEKWMETREVEEAPWMRSFLRFGWLRWWYLGRMAT